jgi:hypothetical protein
MLVFLSITCFDLSWLFRNPFSRNSPNVYFQTSDADVVPGNLLHDESVPLDATAFVLEAANDFSPH